MIAASITFVRFGLLLAISLSLTLIAAGIGSYPQFLYLRGARTFVFESAGLLLLYLPLVLFATRVAPLPPRALLQATRLGAVASALQISHLCIERFVSLNGRWNGVVALASMLSTFTVWAISGFLARRSRQSTGVSVWMSIWSAIVTMTLTVAAGLALELFLAPRPLESMRSWGEFTRSGWTDLHAFAIANTLDAASSHLFIGPIVATVVGTIGVFLARNPHKPLSD
jgi:hypothetical protein